jgi:hypothetical protein
LEYRRRLELDSRIEQLNRDLATWRRAERIRAYVKRVADRLAQQGSITPDSDEAKWLAWARQYADKIDPACSDVKVSPQEFGLI